MDDGVERALRKREVDSGRVAGHDAFEHPVASGSVRREDHQLLSPRQAIGRRQRRTIHPATARPTDEPGRRSLRVGIGVERPEAQPRLLAGELVPPAACDRIVDPVAKHRELQPGRVDRFEMNRCGPPGQREVRKRQCEQAGQADGERNFDERQPASSEHRKGVRRGRPAMARRAASATEPHQRRSPRSKPAGSHCRRRRSSRPRQ